MAIKAVMYCLLLLFPVLRGPTKLAGPKDNAELVRMVELLGSPDHFNGKVVTVYGYLVIDEHLTAGSLILDKNDYENELGNGMGVALNSDMVRNSKVLTGRYVGITGRIVTREWPSGRMLAIEDITECKVWSDPEHPRTATSPSPPDAEPK